MGADPARSLGQTGKLEPGESETTQAIRRRLNAVAELLGVSLEVGRTSGAVYFWASEGRHRGQAPQELRRILLSQAIMKNASVLVAVDLSSAAGFGPSSP